MRTGKHDTNQQINPMKTTGSIGRYTLTAILLLLSLPLIAQRTVVRVVDDQTSEPCMYSNVLVNGLDGLFIDAGATNLQGEIVFELDKPAEITVSFVGYETHTETINPGGIKTIRLKTDFIAMDAVVVTGQYKPKPVDKSIYKIDVLDAKTLQERGVNNLAEALSNETGIRLNVDPATGTSIKMQGMGGENVKYLIDGVPVVGRVLGNIDLSQINVENIDHIEIVQGPMSVQYGTSAIAGVINIITKKNNYFKNIIRGNSYLDTKGNYNFGLYGSVIRGNHTFALSGNRNLFQGMDIDLHVDSLDADGHDRYMEFRPKLTYTADAEYAFSKNLFQLRVKSQYMNSLVKQYGNANEAMATANDADFLTTRSINSLVINGKISESLGYDIIGSYTYFGKQTHYIHADLYELTKEVTDTTSTVFNNIMTRGNFTYAPEESKISLMAGWDINYDNGSGDKIEEGAQMGDFALYLSSQYTPVEKLSLQPGIRFIYNTIYGAPVIPSFNLQWTIFKDLGFRASYARGFRAPSLKELYLDFKDSNHDVYGNKDLKAETTNSYNLSFNYAKQWERTMLKIEPGFFYNNGKDAIVLRIIPGTENSATYENLSRRRTLGGQINASFNHKTGLSLGLGASRIGETFDDEGKGEFLPMIYYNNYSINSKYSFRKLKAVLMANLKYYGETPVLAAIPEEAGGGHYHVFTDPYADLEFTVTKTLWKDRLSVIIGGKNLLDNYVRRTAGFRDYGQDNYQYEYIGALNYGRTWFVKLNLRLIK